MRILFISQFYYPDIQATSKIFKELCEDLALDHKVQVLCGLPLVEAHRAFSAPSSEENINSVDIRRVSSSRNVRKTNLNRVMNHFTFFLSAFCFLLAHRKVDVVLFSSDNPLNVFLALMFRRKPKIYLNQDLYAEQAKQTGAIKGILFNVLEMLQRLAYKVSDKIVVIGETMGKYLVNDKGVPDDKVAVIANWADTDVLTPRDRENSFSKDNGLANKFVVMHSGRLGLTQDLELLLKCASNLKKYKDIEFVIIGEGAKRTKIKKLAKNLGLDNVSFMHYQPEETLSEVFSAASTAVILYNTKLSHSLVPSRLFSFMSCSRPVIASVDEGCSAAKIIKNCGCGITINFGDGDALQKAILSLYNDPHKAAAMGKRGRYYVVNNYSRNLMTEKYRTLIASVVDETANR